MLSRRELLEVVLASGLTAWAVDDLLDHPSKSPGLVGDHRPVNNVKDFGAVGDGRHADGQAIQKAIAAQQEQGGMVFLPPGTYLLSDVFSLVPAPWPKPGRRPLVIKGSGIDKTVVKVGRQNGGVFWVGLSGQNPVCAPLRVSHMTFDGNYVGVQQGAFHQNHGQMISLTVPYQSAHFSGRCSGEFHTFDNVRFYRPQGYVFQPATCAVIQNSIFDSCGQPERPVDGVHYDSVGGGGDVNVRILNTEWVHSAGNYVDLVQENPGHPSRVTMVGCHASDHLVGGIYGAGKGSIIALNHLTNRYRSGIGYDIGTSTENRSGNIVIGNVLRHLTVYTAGLSGAYGDVVAQNIAEDSPMPPETVPRLLKPNVAYRNSKACTVVLYQSVYATSGTSAGRIEVYLGPSAFPNYLFSQGVNPGTSSKNPVTVSLTVPSGFYYAFKTFGAQLDATVMTGN